MTARRESLGLLLRELKLPAFVAPTPRWLDKASGKAGASSSTF